MSIAWFGGCGCDKVVGNNQNILGVKIWVIPGTVPRDFAHPDHILDYFDASRADALSNSSFAERRSAAKETVLAALAVARA